MTEAIAQGFMNAFKIGIFLTVMALGGVGVAMAATNPTPPRYNDYATWHLSAYLQNNLCRQADNVLGADLQDECGDLIDNNQAEIRALIADNTDRQNLVVVSIYRTNLEPDRLLPPVVRQFLPPGVLPDYEFETVGLFGQFVTYKARRQ